jgi:hypothetical protein
MHAECSAEFQRMQKEISKEVFETDNRLSSVHYGLKNANDRLNSLRIENRKLRSYVSDLRDRRVRDNLEILKLRSFLVEVPLNITQGFCNTCGVPFDEERAGALKYIMDGCGAVCINLTVFSPSTDIIDSQSAHCVHKTLM